MPATKMTTVIVDRVKIMGLRGHVSRTETIQQTRAYYEQQAKKAARYLAAIDAGDVRVCHDLGLYRVTSRKEAV